MIENDLVPKHEVLNPENTEELLNKLRVKRELLPKIKRDDPAIKKIDIQVGDIIKITRHNPIIGESLYYRVVIA